jgi:hypothetical protein
MPKRKTTSQKLEPRQQLELFIKRVNELNQRPIIQQGNLHNLRLRTHIDQSGWSYELNDVDGKPIDEEAFRSLLLDLRQFISNNEPIFLSKVFKICDRYLTDNAPRERFERAWRFWKNYLQGKTHLPADIVDNDELLTSPMILDMWINCHYFHNDPEHIERLERWKDHLDLLNGHFKMIIQDLVHLTRWFGGFVNQAFEEHWIDFSRSH